MKFKEICRSGKWVSSNQCRSQAGRGGHFSWGPGPSQKGLGTKVGQTHHKCEKINDLSTIKFFKVTYLHNKKNVQPLFAATVPIMTQVILKMQ